MDSDSYWKWMESSRLRKPLADLYLVSVYCMGNNYTTFLCEGVALATPDDGTVATTHDCHSCLFDVCQTLSLLSN